MNAVQVHKSLRLCVLLLLLAWPAVATAKPSPAAVSIFNAYIQTVELRLARQHGSIDTFVAKTSSPEATEARLRQGGSLVERLAPSAADGPPGALLHHWRGTAFAPGATAASFERLLRDFTSYPRHFAPQVLKASVLNQQGDRFNASMRVRQTHVITVVMDTTYDVSFGQLDPSHRYSASLSTRIAEIDSPGTASERALGPDEEHGFLWRLNTYWSYEERGGGLYIQIESVSLTRAVPAGLGWAVRPYVESVPRDSLEFTLRSVCNSLRK